MSVRGACSGTHNRVPGKLEPSVKKKGSRSSGSLKKFRLRLERKRHAHARAERGRERKRDVLGEIRVRLSEAQVYELRGGDESPRVRDVKRIEAEAQLLRFAELNRIFEVSADASSDR